MQTSKKEVQKRKARVITNRKQRYKKEQELKRDLQKSRNVNYEKEANFFFTQPFFCL